MTSSINASTPGPEPDPGEIARGISDMERWLADWSEPPQDLPDGETRRVRRLRAEVAESHRLAELQDDDTPLTLDTPKVRKRRKKAHEAARLHQLGQDPAMRAWQAARMRRVLVAAAMVSLALALAWSTAGVQAFAAGDAEPWSPSWLFAWLVEPFMSLALLTVVGAKAYMGVRGQPIASTQLDRIELLFLGLTVGMNAWPYLPGVAAEFDLSRLVLHILGPVVAVAIVTALPIILAAFARLDHGPTDRPAVGLTPLTYSGNTPADGVAGNPPVRVDVAELTERARGLIAAGDLPAEPSANAVRQALRCGMDTARAVRDALRADR